MCLKPHAIGFAVIQSICLSKPIFAQTELAKPEQAQKSAELALQFLLRNQEPDGAWGSQRNSGVGIDEWWTNPETHRSWTVAVTALGCLAVWESSNGESGRKAYEHGVDYLLANALVKRPSEWDVDNTWGYVYGLEALAHAFSQTPAERTERRESIKAAGQAVIQELAESQTPNGGWGYYDFDAYTHPGSWSTSFMTAVGVLALFDARDAGFTVDAKMLDAAVRAVRRCRLPSGAYTYSVEAVPSPGRMEWIDQIKGSLSRIQVCNLALRRAGEGISDDDFRQGLDHFFKEHRFLDIARQKPIPHEAYYLNSGYFYFFGHYYAAQVIAMLPRADQDKYWPQLQHHIIKTQESDGSMWDYYMNSYHRPYGAAFSLMALQRSLNRGRTPSTLPEAARSTSE